ncbi:ArsR/SmtB family transcription factor [Kitasatospora indigofera]|uniref:ArsR/SmtB family transcription factor n=1 Tax=Kitasatospora indigofera TaxID=67307 RepID=UPI00363AE622
MGHAATDSPVPQMRLDASNAAKVATTLQALATPSRLLILAQLREGPRAATELADAVGMEQSACSHQLRLLRNLGLVVGERRGRSVVYSLYDAHVAALLDQAVYHVDHLRLGLTDDPDQPDRA